MYLEPSYALPPPPRLHRLHYPSYPPRVPSELSCCASWRNPQPRGPSRAKQDRRFMYYGDDGNNGRLGDDDDCEENRLGPTVPAAATFRKVPWHPNLHMLKLRQL
ncbi:hypothetical protein TKK_0019303 [Trichogramma kaykai]